MSADLLHEAAALMRHRAQGVPSGPWRQGVFQWDVRDASDRKVLGAHNGNVLVGEYVASWHPAVALAVATWLESEADTSVALPEWFENCPESLAVARAYLGRPS